MEFVFITFKLEKESRGFIASPYFLQLTTEGCGEVDAIEHLQSAIGTPEEMYNRDMVPAGELVKSTGGTTDTGNHPLIVVTKEEDNRLILTSEVIWELVI